MIVISKASTISLAALCFPVCLAAGSVFDAHLHYNATDAAHYSPEQIIQKLNQSDVAKAVITSTPSRHAMRLYQHAPDRILPLLGIYRLPADKARWPQDESLPARIEEQLNKGGWHGIGELHIFAKDRHSPIFRRIIRLAGQYRVPLLLHADPAVIDTLYDIAPEQTVIWAHAGTFPYPDLVADYLQRYPSLYVDLSVRDERIAPSGEIRDDWYELFIRHPDRFLIGVDTYNSNRWHNFASAMAKISRWTAQLPDDVAARFTHDNAAALFDKTAQSEQRGR